MPYTNILRVYLSGLRRIPRQVSGQVHLMGQCPNLTPSSRLVTVRRLGALTPRISTNDSKQSLCCTRTCLINVSNTQRNIYSFADERPKRDKVEYARMKQEESQILFKKLLEEGKIQTLEPRNVTSLPEKFKRTGNETFVACDMTVFAKFPNYELFTITASSGSDKFQQVCKPTQEFEYISSYLGMVYDENTEQVLRDGKPVELTDPKEALQQFIDFLKKHNNPVLVFYDTFHDIRNISVLMNNWGLLDDFISEVQYCFEALGCVKKFIAKEDVDDLKLATICEKLMGLKIEGHEQIKRVDALHRLFTEHFQQKVDEVMPYHTNTFYTKSSLVKMVVDGQIHVLTVKSLSKAGIGLDHLNFLAGKGLNEFVSCLVDRGIPKHRAEKLYSVFQKF